jgi:YidC/Oxa1 family membrane protein insertase
MKNQEDNDVERRIILAIILSMAVLFLTPYAYKYFYPEALFPVEVAEQVSEEDSAGVPVDREESPEVKSPPDSVGVDENFGYSGIEETQGVQGQFIVENEDLLLHFDTRGAVLGKVELKRYLDSEGNPLKLITGLAPAELGSPLLVTVEGERSLKSAVYEVSPQSSLIRAPATVKFTYRSGDLEIIKTIDIPMSGYQMGLRVEASKRGIPMDSSITLGPGVGSFDNGRTGDFRTPRIVFNRNSNVTSYDEGDIEDGIREVDRGARWFALDSKYFTFLLLPPEKLGSVRLFRESILVEDQQVVSEGGDEFPLLMAEVEMPVGEGVILFLGPKKTALLKGLDPSLLGIIDYGWFGVVVRPMLTVLRYIYDYVGNYGWAIIILTFLINLALFPVNYKQMASMKKMSGIQPQMKAIQNRYKQMKKDDPKKQEQNAEVMALYKQHGVNPLGGCLPMLVQMPILFAFYRMLEASIELKGAPFIFWIQDLAKPDPYYITPIVMGLTMVLQQKMTPTGSDPTQKKIMTIMPIALTFMFLSISSGLAVYFLFSNIFRILLQVGMKKLSPDTDTGKKAASKESKSEKETKKETKKESKDSGKKSRKSSGKG